MTESWWTVWWAVVQKLKGQVATFLALAPHQQIEDHYCYFLSSVTPCLTGFFDSCLTTKLYEFLDDGCLDLAEAVTSGLIAIANLSAYATKAQVEHLHAFHEIMTQVHRRRAVGTVTPAGVA